MLSPRRTTNGRLRRLSTVVGVCCVGVAACTPSTLAEAHKVAADAPVTQECDNPPPDAARVTLAGRDGVQLGAISIGPQDATTAVILVHGSGQDACVFLPVAGTIAATHPEIRVVALALRGRGASQGNRTDTAEYAYDVVALIEAMRSAGAQRTVLLGTSVGAGTALIAGSLATPPVNGVVAVSSPSSIGGIDVPTTVSMTEVPTWLVVSEGDGPFVTSHKVIVKSISELRANVTVPGDLHGMRLMLSEAQDEILTLLDAAIATE